MGHGDYFCGPAVDDPGKDNRQRPAFAALGYNFLRRAIGWEPPPSG